MAALTLAACDGGPTHNSETQGPPSSTGTVNLVVDAGDPLVFTLSSLPQDSFNNVVITVAAANLVGATPDQVARGDKVSVWAGVCTESLPMQCQAGKVEVTK